MIPFLLFTITSAGAPPPENLIRSIYVDFDATQLECGSASTSTLLGGTMDTTDSMAAEHLKSQ